MANGTLAVWRFDTPEGAEETLRALAALAREGRIDPPDAAAVSWPQDSTRLRASELRGCGSVRALEGPFWGILLGFVFFVPLIGAALGTATGLMSGGLSAVGIDDSFINSIRDLVTPGTSALFVLATDGAVDRVRDALTGPLPSDSVVTGLTVGQEQALREVFGVADSPVAGDPAVA